MPQQVDFRTIADLSYETDPENENGYVAEVGSTALARSYCEQLEAAGFEASWSSDDDKVRAWVWVIAEESEEEEDIYATHDYESFTDRFKV